MMNDIIFILLASLVAVSEQSCDWQLHWSDEFNGPDIDWSKWSHEITAWGGGNAEFQVYTTDRANGFIKDGNLVIKPTLLEKNINPLTSKPFGSDFLYNGVLDLKKLYGSCTANDHNDCVRTGAGYGKYLNIPPVASTRLRTTGKFSFRFGKVEIRAKMPVADWTWPAIWMLPEWTGKWCYGNWPRSGEIDIVESQGNEFFTKWGGQAGIKLMASTAPFGMAWDDVRFPSNYRVNQTHDYGNHFHIYGMEWTLNGLRISVDGNPVLDLPYPLIHANHGWTGMYDFGNQPNHWKVTDPNQNPWTTSNFPKLAPFDTKFQFILNVAVGGRSFLDANAGGINRYGDPKYTKPWMNSMGQSEAMTKFYDKKDGWEWNWQAQSANDNNDGMKIDYIRVYKKCDLPQEGQENCPV